MRPPPPCNHPPRLSKWVDKASVNISWLSISVGKKEGDGLPCQKAAGGAVSPQGPCPHRGRGQRERKPVVPPGWKRSRHWEERGSRLDTSQGSRKEGWRVKSGQEPLWHGLPGGMGGPGAGGAEAGPAAPTGAEPVVALPLVVHLHHAHEVEVLDLPMGRRQWQVTTCTEPAQGADPGKGDTRTPPHLPRTTCICNRQCVKCPGDQRLQPQTLWGQGTVQIGVTLTTGEAGLDGCPMAGPGPGTWLALMACRLMLG